MRAEQFIAAALAQLEPDVRRRARDDVRAVLEQDRGFHVAELPAVEPHREGHGSCDGVSFIEDRTVLFRPTVSRRENFTLAHELGHILVRECDEVQDWLADLDAGEEGRMEEWLCDQIAQRILLPDDLIAQFTGPVSAEGLVALFDASQASLAACAVATSRRLPGPAGIVLINIDTGEVDLASVQPDSELGWPANFPWRNQRLPDGHQLQRLRQDLQATARGRMTWTTPWGDQSSYYVDAQRHAGQIIAVFADQDLWSSEQLHLDGPREFRRGTIGTVRCCGETHEVSTFPCGVCHGHYCPTCHLCRCDKRAATEVLCTRCYQRKQRHLVTNGICIDCQ